MTIANNLIAALLEAIPGCLAIYRFGSWGSASARPESDIDLAVLPCRPLAPLSRWELSQKLAVVAGREVDLVDLLQASTVLRMQVVGHGERIHCADRSRVERFEDLVYSSYARLNEERRDILDDIRKRGSIHGQ
jgi:predicted nucleotidyltransferase